MATETSLDIFFAPEGTTFSQFKMLPVAADGKTYQLRYPLVTPEELTALISQLQQAQAEVLAPLSVNDLVTKLGKAVAYWTDPNYPLRQLAERLLPAITGYNAETVRLELKRFVRVFRKKELQRFLETELDQPAILDDFHPQKSGQLTRAYGPETVFQVFSGNIPGLQIWSLVMTTLVKASTLGKTSLSEPLFPVLFIRSLVQVDPRLAACFVILPWKGGTKPLETVAARQTAATIVYGSDQAVTSIGKLVPLDHRFLHYGHKISFAMIGREALTPDHYLTTIKQVADDITIYDQQSCLSAQTILVEAGGAVTPLMVAQLLATELENAQLKRPRAQLTQAEAAALVRFRSENDLAALADSQIKVFASKQSTAWTVVYHGQPGFAGSPLNRTVHIFQIPHLEQAPTYLTVYRPYLQSCGLAVGPERLLRLAAQLGKVGVGRICALGEMTRAQAGWHHDGQFNLLDLLRFVDIEHQAELAAEPLDPDVE